MPLGFNLNDYSNAAINVSSYLPAEPVELFPDLWKGTPLQHSPIPLHHAIVEVN
jgi:hypothetical protein